MRASPRIEHLAPQDIVRASRSVQEGDLVGVAPLVLRTVAQYGVQRLDHRRDTGAAGDHADLPLLERRWDLHVEADVLEFHRAPYGQFLAHVLRQPPVFAVILHEEVEASHLVIRANRRVRAYHVDNLAALAVVRQLRTREDARARRDAQRHRLVGQSESEEVGRPTGTAGDAVE